MQVKEESSTIDPILVDGLILGLFLMPFVFGLKTTLLIAGSVGAGAKVAEASLPFLPPYAQDRYRRTLALTKQVTG